MRSRPAPASAAWHHQGARAGFEVAFLGDDEGGYLVEGSTAAVEDGEAWVVRYAIVLSPDWPTRSARVTGRSAGGRHERTLEADGNGRWRVDGEPAPHVDGCLDVDLESSALTNAFPVQRLDLEVGEEADAPALYLRALDLSVERLEQRYARLDNVNGRQRYRYVAPAFDFECELVYDGLGLVVDYPGIAARAA